MVLVGAGRCKLVQFGVDFCSLMQVRADWCNLITFGAGCFSWYSLVHVVTDRFSLVQVSASLMQFDASLVHAGTGWCRSSLVQFGAGAGWCSLMQVGAS